MRNVHSQAYVQSSNRSHGADATDATCDLLQRVNKAVCAAEVKHPIHDERRRINSADTNLLIGCHDRRFTPVGMKKKRHIEPSIAGKHPTVVLLGLLQSEIPQQIALFWVTRFQRAV